MIIFKFLSCSSGMQSLASRNGCKVILNDLLDICLDVILWSLLSLPVTRQYIEISYREGEGKMAWLDWSPDIYTLFFYVVNLPSPLTHPNRCSSIFFLLLQAGSERYKDSDCVCSQTITIFETGEHTNWPLQVNSPFGTSFSLEGPDGGKLLFVTKKLLLMQSF